MRTGSATAAYVLGITTGDAAVPTADAPTMPHGGPLRSVRADGIQAVVCDVDVATYERLEDPDADDVDLLAAAARSHDALLAGIAESAPVLPLRLGTLLPDDETIHVLLERHLEPLHTELERLRGYAEWSVRVRERGEPTDDGSVPQASSGADYLRSRQAALSAREQRWRDRRAVGAAVHEALSGVAADSSRGGRAGPDDGGTSVLDAAYLVADGERDRFAGMIERLRTEHELEIEVTGPWPAYHFTSVDLGGGGADGQP